MPVFLKSLNANSDLSWSACEKEIIQFALLAFMTDAGFSTLTWSSGTWSSSCFFASSAYQSWNLRIISSYIGLLRGHSMVAVYLGSLVALAQQWCCDWRMPWTWGVDCPLKLSKIANAGEDFSSFRDSLLLVIKETIPSNILFHGLLIWPVIIVMPNIPSIREYMCRNLS